MKFFTELTDAAKDRIGVDKMQYGTYHYHDKQSGNDVDLPFRVYFPTGFASAKEGNVPILLFLHGYGECGTDNELQIRVLHRPNKLLDMLIEEDSCVILAPQCPADPPSMNWVPINKIWNTCSRSLTENPTATLAAAMSLLDQTLAFCGAIDRDRVYAAGISMGGYATWEVLARRPELFAAAIPLCGAGIPERAQCLTDIAIWAMHGEEDTTVPPRGTREMEVAIQKAGGTKMKATYYPIVGHNVWDAAYAEKGLLSWLLSQRKSK